ncbi:AAA family ATPase [Marinobacterium stanieri]|uniref:MoxR-like ATPase n=1 Tax=Marinobacterium stanieri TaxID=49186 RepID=A0A1N6U547_9GAMM|nr:MoxR family ATPase [Marinobacterium stanieri]SIQ60621.1 MoxR-like ATPase [Marinobacterium stanieri]
MTTHTAIRRLITQLEAEVLGQHQLIEQLMLALLADGHVLIESLPGLAKTRTVKRLAHHLNAGMSRIQFTPDLLPSDLTGSEVLHYADGVQSLQFEPGPLFGNLILADEINRAPAKVQSALLEVMEERQITVSGHTHHMPNPFMVLATQNPIEQEGTYPLPEAQMDRFLMKLQLEYPNHADECAMLRLVRGEQDRTQPDSTPVLEPDALLAARQEINQLFVSPKVDEYIVSLVQATRPELSQDDQLRSWVTTGASPRGCIALDRAARAHAWLYEQAHVTPDNVRAVALPVLRHRLRLSYDAIADRISEDDVVTHLLDRVAIPA